MLENEFPRPTTKRALLELNKREREERRKSRGRRRHKQTKHNRRRCGVGEEKFGNQIVW